MTKTSAAIYMISLLEDDTLAGLEENGFIHSSPNMSDLIYKKLLVKTLLKKRKFWEEVWHQFEEGFSDCEGSETKTPAYKKMAEAKKLLDEHHEIKWGH